VGIAFYMDSNFDALLNKVTEFSKTQFENEYKKGSWGKGLLLFGLIAKYMYDDDEKALGFVKQWVIQSIKTQNDAGELGGGDPSQVNFALIGLAVLFFAEKEKGSDLFLEGAKKQANYFITNPLKRTTKGAIYYLKNMAQVWVDTVIMICPFLVWAGSFFNMPEYTEEAVKQLQLHIACLKDQETGLYRHIWDDSQKKFYEGSLWGRGNGWMLVSLVDVAERLPPDHPHKNQLISEIQRLVELLVLCQDPTGYWRFFLDDVSEKSKIETSGTLIIIYGISKAIRNEWIDLDFSDYVLQGFDAVISSVTEQGFITNA
jgi:unsaturated rhamnogalacturonyl hydrolase